MNLNGTENDDTLVGTTGADLIFGFGGNDAITGDVGDDTLSGGAGDDAISGDGWNDHLEGGAGNDTLDGGADFDAAVYDFSSFTTGVNFQGLVSPLSGVTTSQADGLGGIDTVRNVESLEIFGGSGADVLSSRDTKDFIDGGDGNDVLTGGGGDDTFAFNTLSSGAGIDLITDLRVGDRIQFTNFILDTGIPLSDGDGSTARQGEIQIGGYSEATDTTHVYVGLDDVAGADFSVTLQGEYNASLFSRGIVFTGTPYSQLILVSPLPAQAGENLTGTGGDDVIAGTHGNDTISGGGGNDVIQGGFGDDAIDGGGGNDRLFGGRGNDTLDGGLGGFMPGEVSTDGNWNAVVYDFSSSTTSVIWPQYPAGFPSPNKFPTNQVPDGQGGLDTLVFIQEIELYGGSAADQLVQPNLKDGRPQMFVEGNGGDDFIGLNLGGLGGRGTVAFDAARTDLGVDRISGFGFGARILLRNFDFDMSTSLSIGDGTALTQGQVQFGAYDAASNVTRVYVGTDAVAGADLMFDMIGQFDLARFSRTDAGADAYLAMDVPPPDEPIIFTGTDTGDNVAGRGANDSISGGSGRDTLAGAGGDDTLRGDGGDDHLEGGAGNDLLDGGFNYDAAVYNFSDSTAAVTFTGTLDATPGATSTQADGLGGIDTLVNVETLEIYGGSAGDTLTGSASVDFIEGRSGDDVLTGGAGSDTFAFQTGAFSNLGTDLITDLGDGDHILLRSFGMDMSKPLSTGDGTAVTNGEVQFSAYDQASNTTRIFVGWDDTAGADLTIVLQGQYDPANFSRSAVTTGVLYSELVYTPPPPPADPAQTFDGTSIADTFTGGTGNDTLNGGGGNDTLTGGGGDDLIDGQAGTDRLFGGDGQDSVFGGSGSDHIEGGNGHDVLVGGIGNDQLWGDEGADWLQGDDGSDRLTGGGGDDFLVGGIGSDTLVGNAGADTFFFDSGTGVDRIDFFFVSHGDKIRIASNANSSGILTADDAYAHLTDTVDGALLDLGGGNTVLLTGVHPSGLTPAIFEIV